MNWMIRLMMNPFMLYSDYVFEIQHGEADGPILTFEEWKKAYYNDEEEKEEKEEKED